MSKLVLQSNASGIGTVLLHTSTKTSTDINLELPSSSGRIALVGESGSSGSVTVDGIPSDTEGAINRFTVDTSEESSSERVIEIQNFPVGIPVYGSRITVQFKNGLNNVTKAWFNINSRKTEGSDDTLYFRESALTYCPKGSVLDFVYAYNPKGWHVVDQGLDLYTITQGTLEIQ